MTTTEQIMTLIGSALGFIILLEARVRSLVKVYLSELKPNGGGSVKDQVNRLEGRVDDIYALLINDRDRTN
jgi:hypothetical protein